MTDLVNLSESTVVKAGNAFCVAWRDGSLPLAGEHPLGLYRDDCRHLRSYEMRLAGRPPRLLVGSDAAGNGGIFEFTNPDLTLADGRALPLQSMRVRMVRRILSDAMIDVFTVRSHAREPVEFELELQFDADFRPMLEVRGLSFEASGERELRREPGTDTLTFAGVGLDERERSTTISCAGGVAGDDGRLMVPIALQPGEERTVEVVMTLAEHEPAGSPNGQNRSVVVPVTGAASEAAAWLAERPRIDADDELVDKVLRRSLLDLRLLASSLDGQRYYAAGVPWYATLFGRDSIITALEMLAFDPAMAEETLRLLAARQGREMDDEHDEEPGKILHELRRGELAALDVTPLTRYYGTVDATPLFLCLLCEHANWSGSLALFRELRANVEQAIRWIDEFGDLDGDGLLEYACRSHNGLVNQGWKDSWDGVIDESGTPLRAPIALVEVQGYVVRAKRALAPLFELDGDEERAGRLRTEAAAMAARLERFWLDDCGRYAMALDGEKRPSRALASNQGHLLWALAVPPERAAAVRDSLLGPDLYSGWGIRTLADNERAFNPVGYHAGTVWPHDNAITAVGLRKYGYDEAFLRIFDDLLDAAATFTDYRLPELFAGFSRNEYEDPVPYPVACSPQAWAAGSLPYMLTSGLGLVPDGLHNTLRIRRPSLPRPLDRLALDGLQIAGSSVDLLFERVTHGTNAVALTDVRIRGNLEVVLEVREPVRSRDVAPTLQEIHESAAAEHA